MVDRLTDLICEPNLKQFTSKSPQMIEECIKVGFGSEVYINNLVFTFSSFWRLFSNGAIRLQLDLSADQAIYLDGG